MPTAAVIGASNDRRKYGNKAFRALRERGFTVWPVNPTESEVEGAPAFKSIRDVPERPEMVTLYVRPEVVMKILPDIAAKGCDELWLNPGTDSDEVLRKAEELKLNVIQACTIIGVGMSPAAL
jgi:predicted CoA-binding protein